MKNEVEMRAAKWHKNSPMWVTIKLFVWLFVFFLFFLGGRIFFRQQEEFRRVAEREKVIEARYQETIANRNLIESQYKDIKSDQQLEEISREELGFVRAGDIVYEDKK